jgi:hypothetical protein
MIKCWMLGLRSRELRFKSVNGAGWEYSDALTISDACQVQSGFLSNDISCRRCLKREGIILAQTRTESILLMEMVARELNRVKVRHLRVLLLIRKASDLS